MKTICSSLPPIGRMPRHIVSFFLPCLLCFPWFTSADGATRQSLSLDGVWQVAEGKMDQMPTVFDRTVPVPGLVDMATPPFESPGATVSADDRGKPWLRPADPRREAFWYRRTFKLDGPVPAVALLKVHKARYGTKVFLNGKPVGEHWPCFTPGWFDVRPFLKGDGAGERAGDPRRRFAGPGAAAPDRRLGQREEPLHPRHLRFGRVDPLRHAARGQRADRARCRAEVRPRGRRSSPTPARPWHASRCKRMVREAKSGRVRGRGVAWTPTLGRRRNGQGRGHGSHPRRASAGRRKIPFLYELDVDTGADALRDPLRPAHLHDSIPRRAARCSTASPTSSAARTSASTASSRTPSAAALPWDETGCATLHRRFKEMHWNSPALLHRLPAGSCGTTSPTKRAS